MCVLHVPLGRKSKRLNERLHPQCGDEPLSGGQSQSRGARRVTLLTFSLRLGQCSDVFLCAATTCSRFHFLESFFPFRLSIAISVRNAILWKWTKSKYQSSFKVYEIIPVSHVFELKFLLQSYERFKCVRLCGILRYFLRSSKSPIHICRYRLRQCWHWIPYSFVFTKIAYSSLREIAHWNEQKKYVIAAWRTVSWSEWDKIESGCKRIELLRPIQIIHFAFFPFRFECGLAKTKGMIVYCIQRTGVQVTATYFSSSFCGFLETPTSSICCWKMWEWNCPCIIIGETNCWCSKCQRASENGFLTVFLAVVRMRLKWDLRNKIGLFIGTMPALQICFPGIANVRLLFSMNSENELKLGECPTNYSHIVLLWSHFECFCLTLHFPSTTSRFESNARSSFSPKNIWRSWCGALSLRLSVGWRRNRTQTRISSALSPTFKICPTEKVCPNAITTRNFNLNDVTAFSSIIVSA